MENKFFIFRKVALFMFLVPVLAFGQGVMIDGGIGVGTTNFIGDVGGGDRADIPVYPDFDYESTRPAVELFFRYYLNPRIALRANGMFGYISADDRFAEFDNDPDAFYRYYRNLHFRTHIAEIAGRIELSLREMTYTRRSNKWTPFVSAGVGLFHFNPKAELDGQWVRLQPLGTEGQGLSSVFPEREPYKLLQPNLQLGGGVKFFLNRDLFLNIEINHRYTPTDYIDDVSTTYVDPEIFIENYGFDQQLLSQVLGLSRRSNLIDPSEAAGFITAPGEQRGDPTDKDGYFSMFFGLSYDFGGRYYPTPGVRR